MDARSRADRGVDELGPDQRRGQPRAAARRPGAAGTIPGYMSAYAREQADCHLSPALVSNLERHWNARIGASEPRSAMRSSRCHGIGYGRCSSSGCGHDGTRAAAAATRRPAAGILGVTGPGDLSTLADLRGSRLHQGRPARALSVRVARGPARAARPRPCLERHPRQADRRRLHAHRLDSWTEVMARGMAMAGVKRGMMIHNANGYGLFTGGLGFHQGGERIGATVVPVSGGFTARQAILLRDLRHRCSWQLRPTRWQSRRGSPTPPTPPTALELGLFGGEPWTEAMREQLEHPGITATQLLRALGDVRPRRGCGVPEGRAGLHVQEDHFLVEVVDPASGQCYPPEPRASWCSRADQGGTAADSLPNRRHRLGSDRAVPCGRTSVRLTGLRGRHDDMLIIRGVNLHPSNVEHLLLGWRAPHPITA